MNHVPSEEVLKIHDLVLLRYGGCPGCPNPERVSALLARVRNYEFYEGLTDVFALAAMYWVAISNLNSPQRIRRSKNYLEHIDFRGFF